MNPDTANGYSRRAALALAGGVTAGLAGCLGSSTTGHGWQRVSSPTKKALRGVVFTGRGPVAAGEGGRVLARTDEDWETVVERGPGNASNGLTGAATTGDGERVWVCGDSGAVGRYDVADGKIIDYSAPEGKDEFVGGRRGRRARGRRAPSITQRLGGTPHGSRFRGIRSVGHRHEILWRGQRRCHRRAPVGELPL